MYLIDTTVVSELRKQRPHGAVVSHLTVVTRNGAVFTTFEVPHLNPFETGR